MAEDKNPEWKWVMCPTMGPCGAAFEINTKNPQSCRRVAMVIMSPQGQPGLIKWAAQEVGMVDTLGYFPSMPFYEVSEKCAEALDGLYDQTRKRIVMPNQSNGPTLRLDK